MSSSRSVCFQQPGPDLVEGDRRRCRGRGSRWRPRASGTGRRGRRRARSRPSRRRARPCRTRTRRRRCRTSPGRARPRGALSWYFAGSRDGPQIRRLDDVVVDGDDAGKLAHWSVPFDCWRVRSCISARPGGGTVGSAAPTPPSGGNAATSQQSRRARATGARVRGQVVRGGECCLARSGSRRRRLLVDRHALVEELRLALLPGAGGEALARCSGTCTGPCR